MFSYIEAFVITESITVQESNPSLRRSPFIKFTENPYLVDFCWLLNSSWQSFSPRYQRFFAVVFSLCHLVTEWLKNRHSRPPSKPLCLTKQLEIKFLLRSPLGQWDIITLLVRIWTFARDEALQKSIACGTIAKVSLGNRKKISLLVSCSHAELILSLFKENCYLVRTWKEGRYISEPLYSFLEDRCVTASPLLKKCSLDALAIQFLT